MVSSAQEWVKKANERLKSCGVSLELMGKYDNLYIRGMFPLKPWLHGVGQTGKKQQRIALKTRALTPAIVKEAEKVAREVGVLLGKGEFDWRQFEDFDHPSTPSLTIGYYAEKLREEKLGSGQIKIGTWKNSYQFYIEKLPLELEPSEDFFFDWILDCDPNCQTNRRHYVTVAKEICRLAGIEAESLSKLNRKNQSKPVNPRNLPTDEAIEAMALSIKDPEWRWVYGMLATYGLRPHELFKLELKQFPDVRTSEDTKTGERIVPPIYPRWVDLFGLTDQVRIPQKVQWSEDMANQDLGRKINTGFAKHRLGRSPYDLRHCYARRCLEFEIPSDIGAALLGHSRKVHEETYRAWINSTVYTEAAKRILARRL